MSIFQKNNYIIFIQRKVKKMLLSEKYLAESVNAKGDLSEHLYTIKKYAEKCEHITELGVRWVISTWALLAGKPKTLNSFDVIHYIYHGVPPNKIIDAAKEQGTDFNFFEENVLCTDKVVPTDLLFIDTLHSYKQLKLELYLHGNKARKYIIITNTVTYGNRNEGPVLSEKLDGEALHVFNNLQDKQGVMTAIKEFVEENSEWRVKEFFKNCNGLCVLERIPVSPSGLAVTGTSMSTTFTGVANNAPVANNTPVVNNTHVEQPAPVPVFVTQQPNNQNSTNKLIIAGLVGFCFTVTAAAVVTAVYFATR